MELLPKLSLVKNASNFEKIKITSSTDAADYIRQFYCGDIDIFESFFLVTLDNSNNTTGYVKISQGGITGTLVDVRIVAKYAIESLATAVVISHNHPSGSLTPSKNDEAVTKKIVEALGFFDIKVLDHLIITTDGYFSFADKGFL